MPGQRHVSRGEGTPALAISGSEAQHSISLCAHAPCRAFCNRLLHYKGLCAGERPLSFGARPWCDVLAAASNANTKTALRVTQRRRAGARYFGGRMRSARAFCARTPCYASRDRLTSFKVALRQREDSLDCRTNVVRRTSCGARCLWGEGAALELAARAHHAALIVVGLGPIKWRCAGDGPVSFRANPWCNVPVTA